ncbi:MAG TPA: HipA family kinase [Gemmatimonadaceae bacterium]|nr:HipA family kinase [Gemmatimonadaceae bacterium]
MLPPLPTVTASRYVQPLREGGSLPAVVDTGSGLFVVKFRGAGQGAKALVAELLVGSLAAALSLPVPDMAIVDLPEPFGRSEPDPEIQDILRRSHGLNVGLRYLDGAFNFAVAAAGDLVEPGLASRIVWFDALVTNPDRTHRNPNILVWERRPWLIDHGAALYAHHDWARVDAARTRSPFQLIEHHVLLGAASELERADTELAPLLTDALIEGALARVPDDLLLDPAGGREFATAGEARARYLSYLRERLGEPRAFVDEAVAVRTRLLAGEPTRLLSRR